ncbi:TonB-dependent receptor [Paraglaciecola arctica]|uniref:TonB-dependent receptor n=1 Tax=Paraglaciecola arctica TaxID=1128911 RepID=UPI001C06BF17|nr:TonB-dependent receptor [Paraglaciecola arctica]MBU3004243.1 TonB-dependent receptor [Paraglaciecola arctica]
MKTHTNKKTKIIISIVAAISANTFAEELENEEKPLIETITVTADRHSKSAQDVAASISAINGDNIETLGIQDVDGLQNFVPGLSIKSQGIGTTSFNIRGVGQAQDDITVESGVGVFIDDIYIPRMGAAGGTLYDLERVEVLRGPQGTLYGRNTAGGSINFITKKPEDYFNAKVSATLGNRNIQEIKAYMTGPLIDEKLMAQASFVSKTADGYMENLNTGNKGNGTDTQAGRIALQYIASDDVSLFFTIDAEDSNPDPTMMNIGPEDGYQSFVHQLFNDLAGFTILPGEAATNFYETNIDNDGEEELKTWGLMTRLEVAHDDFDAAYIFGYRESELVMDADRDMSTLSLLHERHDEDSEWGSFEARFSSNPNGHLSLNQNLEWVVGYYYFFEDSSKEVNLYNEDAAAFATQGAFDGYTALQFFQKQDTEAHAIFGQATYKLTDFTRLTGGARWTTEEKTAGIATNVIDPAGGYIFGPPNNGGIIAEIYDTETTESWDDFTIKLAVEHDLSDDTLLYGSYSEGFKSGGFNGTSATKALAETAFSPENVTNYEFGLKSDVTEWLRANVSLFNMDYKDLQTAIISEGGTPFILNTEADIQGAELDIILVPFADLSVSANASFIDSEYVKSEGAPELIGTQVNGVPEFSYSVAADYFIPLSSGEINFHIDYSWEDETTTTSTLGTVPKLVSWDVINLTLGYTPSDESWKVAAWVKNAADSEYWLSIGSATASTSPADSIARLPAPPITYGVSFSYFWE